MAALHNVQWLTSNKGKPLLIVDDYIFKDAGKGKLQHAPNTRYWVCKHRCGVKAKSDGQNLVSVEGLVNWPDHGHVNDSIEIKDRNLKVSEVINYCII
jgi:FLYWCH zinc finger domain